MPDFVYTAKSLDGNDVSGKLSANSRREVLDVLARQSLFPLTIEDAKKGHIEIKLFKARIPDMLIAQTLTQLADLLENGVPVLSAFQVLVKQATHPALKEVVTDLHDRVADGEAIDSAFAAHPKVFNDLTISIIRAGTEGAFLEDALRRTARFLEVQGELRSKIIGAMIYPIILLIIGISMVLVLVLFFVPQFQVMFDTVEERGGTLPFMTIALLKFRVFLLRYYHYTLIGGTTVFLWLWIQMSTAWGRRFLDRWKLKLPVVGQIFLESAVSRFCRVFGTLLENGVPILRALEISSTSTGNVILSDAILKSADNVSSGESLSRPLAETGIFPPQVMAMITVAEESNTLESVLLSAADTIERGTTRRLDMLIRLLGPMMLLGMGVVVLVIILALLVPIFQIISQLQL
ncbi:MAG: type II secretion system F family protein [Planctomycetaceae bacterium]|nr:type II secretion system F family protein [Planctomycetaceae bacterium]